MTTNAQFAQQLTAQIVRDTTPNLPPAPSALMLALQEAQQTLRAAEQAQQVAQQALVRHEAARPTVPGQVGDWARKRAVLATETDGHAQLVADKRQAVQQAERAIIEARAQAALAQRRTIELERDAELGRLDAQRQQLEQQIAHLWQQRQRVVEQAQRRLAGLPIEASGL